MRPDLTERRATLRGMNASARDRPIPYMDKGSGWKDSAFTWAMGELILARIADGETVKAITADPRMPAYCTVFQWMRVVPAFGEAVAEVRGRLAFREAFVDACAGRNGWLQFQAEMIVPDKVWTIGIPAANAEIRGLLARKGRLTPKLYRKASD